MLNIVCGSITPDSGKILIEGTGYYKEKEYRVRESDGIPEPGIGEPVRI